jgi:hypothetical protein
MNTDLEVYVTNVDNVTTTGPVHISGHICPYQCPHQIHDKNLGGHIGHIKNSFTRV